MKTKKSAIHNPHTPWRIPLSAYIQLILLAVLLFVALPQLDVFNHTLSVFVEASALWVGLTILLWLASVAAAAAVYFVLAEGRLPFTSVALTQLAASFTGRLLPVGIGTIGIYMRFIQKNTKSLILATSVVGVNQIVGFIAFVLLVSLYTLSGPSLPELSVPQNTLIIFGVILVGLLVVAAVWVIRFSKQIQVRLKEVKKTLKLVSKQPIVLVKSIGYAMLISIFLTLALYAALSSIGMLVTPYQAFLVYIGASVATSITPTPGGLGGVEAAMVAVLVGLGFEPSQSLAGVLIYRFITFWLPILPGYVALRYMFSKYYL